MSVFNIFVLPLVSLLLIYIHKDVSGIHNFQISLMIIYWRLLILVVYRLYKLCKGEIRLWYIQHIDDGMIKLELQECYKYYKHIDEDVYQIIQVLSVYIGTDTARIVLWYTPDYIDTYTRSCHIWF